MSEELDVRVAKLENSIDILHKRLTTIFSEVETLRSALKEIHQQPSVGDGLNEGHDEQ